LKTNCAQLQDLQAIELIAALLVYLNFFVTLFSSVFQKLLNNLLSFSKLSGSMFLLKNNMSCRFSILAFVFFTVLGSIPNSIDAQISKEANRWVDSVFHSLTPRQRIGQLFMVAAYSNKGPEHQAEVDMLIKESGIGGLIFFQGGPGRQARLTNYYQSISKVPLWLGMDAEWGLGMRLDSTLNFPKQMTLGALQDVSLIQKMGEIIGRHCKRLGVQVSFSPVVDVNSNQANPVIGYRAFSEDKESVAIRGSAYMKGLQSQGVIAVAKHFPGHGDADADSHYSLPVINRTSAQLQEMELYPFRQLIKDSVAGVMVAHLSIPALDNTPNQASTLSKKIVTDLLRKEMSYDGLIFTDALNMKGVSKYYSNGEADLKALLAGNDVLLFPENVPKAISAIEAAISKKQIRWREVEKRVRRILYGKYWAGLKTWEPIELENLYADLNSIQDKIFIKSLYAKSITIVKNKQNLIPFRNIDSSQFVSILIGPENGKNPFQKSLSNYAKFNHLQISEKAQKPAFDELLKKLDKKVVVVALAKLSNLHGKNYGISPQIEEFIKKLYQENEVVVIHFGNAYSTGVLETMPNIICAYEWNENTQNLVPEVLFGAIQAFGKMPVSAGLSIRFGVGFNPPELERFRSAEPEEVGMKSGLLARIDSFANSIIAQKMTPGCQILVAKDGAVIYNKGFGYQTYDSLNPVNDETIYDIASITKVAGTLQAIMYLQERGQINLWDKASDYLTDLKGTNKSEMAIAELLVHQAGLQPFIPYWKRTLKSKDLAETFYCDEKDNNWFCTEVVPGMYGMKGMEDTLWKWVVQSDLMDRNRKGGYDYKYSDLGFYILKRLAEKVLNEPIDIFLDRRFYNPLGLDRFCYKPKRYFAETEIAPTEEDTIFRRSLIRGNVHDPGAAMFGGVGGHAGLFANAYSLAVLVQMNMNYGYYGGRYFHLPQTVPFFAERPFPRNRRGFGWDKPYLWSKDGPTSQYCSSETFGHTGFTGTCVWADPKYKLVFVFLSNRVFPDAENGKLIKNNIRPRIHDMVYQAMEGFPFEAKTVHPEDTLKGN